ncbi:hypothetical protein J7I94_21480 [Streptomyces sp. ISL-12]|uniref:hypothetical protein n=1 Tax=Streptomyces sp. ISL-12 TaxID=2819177 RepID=UPI001BE88B63|nr:hypothetical protein [Streptomyces sp. ISL-12]MBT2413100.1 hypothetical protein [Streptomyces sp. ISL-12]
MKADVTAPVGACALDDPVTRRTYQRSRRLAVLSVCWRVGVWLALVVVATTVETDEQLVEGLASFLTIPGAFLLVAPARRLRWTISVGRVLESYPWQRCHVDPDDETRTAQGTAVVLRVVGDDGEALATSAMTVSTWRLRRPRSKALTGADWFAGRLERGGVLARSGGRVVMSARRVDGKTLKV